MPFKRLSRLELPFVFLGGPLLAANAGYINTVVLSEGAPAVTHLTGTISRVSADLGHGDLADARFVGGLIVAFVLGSTLSGAIIGSSTLRFGRRYGVALMTEAVLLATAAILIGHSPMAGAILASGAAGLQNAMAASFKSLIVRTTHVTGTLTDLGFLVGQLLTGHSVERWRLALLSLLLAGFVAGGIAGVLAYQQWSHGSLALPAAATGLGGLSYILYNMSRRPIS